ncbi:2-hydroxyacid dehydrogenase [Aliiglaciecola sp. LCG003]|uniref:2-hydroxyacid dehydrogenase n=1 Tax=Aliiglaciecola sp. LCG003 TaxID=3053655 RepID=UPI00257414FB|nr:2-hydroxyacid dehydrogenase [Aliiglaciecola sp. LCG003]WJG07690.1 2-hydroxyacid dehydrogenase [Aliiglaciecola sp. LCG003]
MKVGVFSCKSYDREFFNNRNHNYGYELEFLDCALTPETALLTKPFDAISVFVDDIVNREVLDTLKESGIHHIALRCSGFNNIDLEYAKEIGIGVSRVPRYSPESVAEHTIALILALDRRLFKAYSRVVDNNFELEGLLGFNLANKKIGVIGTGAIGQALIKILLGFGCRVLCNDINPSDQIKSLGCDYVSLQDLIKNADVITLHCPLTAESQHLIDHEAVQNMKDGVMLINTSRGGLVNTKALLAGLKSNKIGYLGIDMYEMESELLNHDLLCEKVDDDIYQRLATFPNVLITGHQGFFTRESMIQVTDTTLSNLQYFFAGKICAETFLN